MFEVELNQQLPPQRIWEVYRFQTCFGLFACIFFSFIRCNFVEIIDVPDNFFKISILGSVNVTPLV